MDASYDTIIIGGGPAGAAAAVYAARKKLKTMMVTENFGGQSIVSAGIQNWIGETEITGIDLAEKLEKHVRAQADIEIRIPEKAAHVKEIDYCVYEVTTDKDNVFCTKTLIVASGARRKKLGVPAEDQYEGRGVAFCSTCDAPFFADEDVAVVGGGNAALETVVDLLPYANRIYMLLRKDRFRGDPVNQERAAGSSKVQIIRHAQIEEIYGDGQRVTGLHYRDKKADESKDLRVGGVFVAIGSVPNSEFMRDLVDINTYGEIIINCRTAETSKKGIFAAGDVTYDPFKQNNIAAGDGVRAALSAYAYVADFEKLSPCAEKLVSLG
jgi:alkyl hydroperoxide reductase subunit F